MPGGILGKNVGAILGEIFVKKSGQILQGLREKLLEEKLEESLEEQQVNSRISLNC